MVHRLSRFAVGQTAKVMGVMYALVGVVLIPFFLFGYFSTPGGGGMGYLVALLLPIVYGLVGSLMTALACAFYNWLAPRVGGIEFHLQAVAPPSAGE